ncbi:glutathione S-transferase U17-like [Magnolia sinica]|uniref:glutathione S-transferase U17-like n=1 Tax=Magnolia sinica TaxID=86752 RepID=UPI002657D99C|nr:glutathione S-transferase U17-like [Magnolia sinica]
MALSSWCLLNRQAAIGISVVFIKQELWSLYEVTAGARLAWGKSSLGSVCECEFVAKRMREVKLWGAWPSPFLMRCRIALNLKSIPYEFLDDTSGYKSQLLLQSNPFYKKIPVLIHKDKPICESMIMVQYIDEVWTAGPTILPTDPYDRAIARFWATYIDDKWFPSLSGIAGAQGEEEKAAAIEEVMVGLQSLEEAFEKCSEGKGFFGGERIGYLDIALGCYLGWLKATQSMTGTKFLDSEKLPQLTGWATRFCSDSSVKDVMPQPEKLVELTKLLQATFKAPALSN